MPHIMYSQGMPKIDGALKQPAWNFLEKLSENDATPGLHIEPINNSVDDRVRTGRVNLNFRAVMFKLVHESGTTYVLRGIYPHDDAIEVARKSKLRMNPVNGVAEVTEIDASPPPAPAPTGPATDSAEDPTSILESWGFVESDLTEHLGIAADTARGAMAAQTEDDLLEVAAGAIEWQGVALLELASGKTVDYVLEILELDRADEPGPEEPTDEELRQALDHPAARLQFAFIEDDEDLRRVIEEGDFAAWRTFLHPEQRRYAEADTSGPFRLSGGAGTGKTVVLLHRARHLHRKNPAARIVLTTYSRTLAESLVQNLRILDPELQLAGSLGESGVVVLGVDQVAAAVLKSASSDVLTEAVAATVGSRSVDATTMPSADAWQQVAAGASSEVSPAIRATGFLSSEYTMVVLPQRITTREQYFKARRPGRGVALDRARRSQVWDLVEAYRSAGAIGRWLDFPEKATVAADVLDRTGPVADHVLVDEGQDLTPSQWQMLRALAASGPNDMFIAEDSHQRIYSPRVVLGRLGIAIVGRSRALTLNYRTTAQNLKYAVRVLTGETYVDAEGEQDSTEYYRSARSGPQPEVIHASSATEELDRTAEVVSRWIDDGRSPETIGVLVRSNKQMTRVAGALDERGVSARQITPQSSGANGLVQVMTMHRAKGMEFECVLVFGLSADAMPAPWMLKDLEEIDRADALQRERSLLYVSATRARDELAIVWHGDPSAMLPRSSSDKQV